MRNSPDMQERKNKLLALSLILLLLTTTAAFYFVAREADDGVDQSIFRIEGLETVDSVELESPRGKAVLRFDGAKWTVNSRYRADAQMIEVLFATLAQVTPKRPLSENLRDSTAEELTHNGTRVALFAGEVLKKEFYVGGNPQKSEAYFHSPSDGPFVMTIPGYRVYVAGVFELDEAGWRDKQVFRFNQRNFRNLTTTFHKDADQSFVITYDDQDFQIPGLADPDTTRIFDYLDGVALLKAEELYLGGDRTWVDSLLAVPPSFTIEVSDTQGRKSRLVIYPPLARQAQVVGRMGDEAALFQKKDIIRIAKKKSYFLKTQ
jgi:hypothetical protein